MDNINNVFVSFDADNAGRKIGRAILSDNVKELKESSDRISLGNTIIEKWAKTYSGTCYSSGGDQGVWAVPAEATKDLESLRNDYEFASGLTVSMGLGNTLSESGKALLVAKFKGKNQVVQYDQSIDDEIARVQESMGHGTASPEETKLGEAYLRPEGESVQKKSEFNDCPYCKDKEEEHSCPYCEENGASEVPQNDCPYCRDTNSVEDCKYCKDLDSGSEKTPSDGIEQTAGPSVEEPTAQTSEDYESKGLNDPAIEKPRIDDHPPIEEASPAIYEADDQHETNSNRALDVKDGNPVETKMPVSPDEIGETPAAILQQLDADGAEVTQDDMAAVNNMDDADLAIDRGAEENVSRPEDYGKEVPRDMGLGEEEQQEEGPDLNGVLQEGLDNHADNIQREKVVQMVSEALEGFKSCKQILEKAKEQAPQLYQSSIAMLRAMIEMAKMLGLSDSTESAEEVVGQESPANDDEAMAQEAEADPSLNDPKQAAPKENDKEVHDWKEPFKPHPSHGQAAAQEDAATKSPKIQSQ
jgi:hypothetical protein